MRMNGLCKSTSVMLALTSVGSLFGCAGYEVNTGRGNIPGHYIRYEMQESDRAVEAARAAGKDKICPDDFQQVEAAKNQAYDVFRACHTEEGAGMAKVVTARANTLCPKVAAPAPVPAAPTNRLTVTPDSVLKGESATLNWTSTNADRCRIDPAVGPVEPQGSLAIKPAENSSYALICVGAGGTVKSSASIKVAAPVIVAAAVPAPPVAVAAAEPAAPKASEVTLCKPAVIDIRFATNKSNIRPEYHNELKKIADFLKDFPRASGTIEGHTDNVGKIGANMKLSQRRAESVRSALIKSFGIAPGRIKAVGYGPTRPIADNKTAAGKTRNRRIESHFDCNGK